MNRILKSLLRAGVDLLEQPPVRDNIRETAADLLRRRIRGKDHTLRYVLTFAAGVGVGIGVSMLTAPGAQSRSTIAGKVQDVGNRIKTQSAAERDFTTGTQG